MDDELDPVLSAFLASNESPEAAPAVAPSSPELSQIPVAPPAAQSEATPESAPVDTEGDPVLAQFLEQSIPDVSRGLLESYGAGEIDLDKPQVNALAERVRGSKNPWQSLVQGTGEVLSDPGAINKVAADATLGALQWGEKMYKRVTDPKTDPGKFGVGAGYSTAYGAVADTAAFGAGFLGSGVQLAAQPLAAVMGKGKEAKKLYSEIDANIYEAQHFFNKGYTKGAEVLGVDPTQPENTGGRVIGGGIVPIGGEKAIASAVSGAVGMVKRTAGRRLQNLTTVAKHAAPVVAAGALLNEEQPLAALGALVAPYVLKNLPIARKIRTAITDMTFDKLDDVGRIATKIEDNGSYFRAWRGDLADQGRKLREQIDDIVKSNPGKVEEAYKVGTDGKPLWPADKLSGPAKRVREFEDELAEMASRHARLGKYQTVSELVGTGVRETATAGAIGGVSGASIGVAGDEKYTAAKQGAGMGIAFGIGGQAAKVAAFGGKAAVNKGKEKAFDTRFKTTGNTGKEVGALAEQPFDYGEARDAPHNDVMSRSGEEDRRTVNMMRHLSQDREKVFVLPEADYDALPEVAGKTSAGFIKKGDAIIIREGEVGRLRHEITHAFENELKDTGTHRSVIDSLIGRNDPDVFANRYNRALNGPDAPEVKYADLPDSVPPGDSLLSKEKVHSEMIAEALPNLTVDHITREPGTRQKIQQALGNFAEKLGIRTTTPDVETYLGIQPTFFAAGILEGMLRGKAGGMGPVKYGKPTDLSKIPSKPPALPTPEPEVVIPGVAEARAQIIAEGGKPKAADVLARARQNSLKSIPRNPADVTPPKTPPDVAGSKKGPESGGVDLPLAASPDVQQSARVRAPRQETAKGLDDAPKTSREAVRARVTAMGRDHVTRNPDTDLLTLRQDQLGEEVMTGRRIDPAEPLHQEIMKNAGLSEADVAKANELSARKGDTVVVKGYRAAPVTGKVDAVGRRADQKASPAQARAAGETPSQAIDKTFVPNGNMVYRHGSGKNGPSLVVNGFSLEKFANNADRMFPWLTKSRWNETETGQRIYTGPKDPKFVREASDYFRNQANGYTGNGAQRVQGTPLTEPVRSGEGFTPVRIPDENVSILNALVGAKPPPQTGVGTTRQLNTLLLQRRNAPDQSPNPIWDAMPESLRAKIEPTIESLKPEQIGEIREAGEATDGIRPTSQVRGAPNQAYAAAGFSPRLSDLQTKPEKERRPIGGRAAQGRGKVLGAGDEPASPDAGLSQLPRSQGFSS